MIIRPVNSLNSVREWKDSKFVSDVSYNLFRMSDEEIITSGHALFTYLKITCSERALANLMNLAYNLRSPSGATYIFPESMEVPPYTNLMNIDISDVSDKELFKSTIVEVVYEDHEDILLLANAYCYLSCSMFKMFTKPVESYENSYDKIRTTFSQFYNTQIPLSNEKPHSSALRYICELMSSNWTSRVTLYKLLYNSNSDYQAYKGMKNYLFDIHLQNNGMHIVNLVLQISDAMMLDIDEILDTISCRRYVRTFSALSELCNNFITSNDPDHQRRMWRYARMFDSDFFAELQTKVCKEIVCILAFMLQRLNHKNSGGIMKIYHIQDMSAVSKLQCQVIADRGLASLRDAEQDDDAGPAHPVNEMEFPPA
ncbi:TPA_asm: nucleocapsid protein [Arceuthobium virus 8]|uniref:Nucleoprotein n=1 Tax=Arceuthobium virus 8 TaxID=2977953 RepID=A0A9N6YJ04_9RHAB|nr:TPA_asm: nucleocapsid protein [Arceuthobium virus 8]